jgi:hypothetical protein
VAARHRCVAWAGSGALLGLAWNAWAQADPTVPAEALTDPGLHTLVELLQGGGLPAVVAILGWLAGRWGGVPLVVSLHADDRALLERASRRMAKALEDDDTPSPGGGG